ncbi:hypothetical protein MmiHf6_07820 [Methanimicrococcus hongohii]|uniref:Stage II sporulation protein M n=1 Tax=Methanimicrococcus hongohii TaxID=3028295 RepID=A0AA96V1B0_9EURY|nr:stage II sporulation protein M [Methanimicrococcus sp. Hf6]WNY23475.1 hypothetical protein MmiHf6_07820 [Methanimicrococcus sp. Hf6]
MNNDQKTEPESSEFKGAIDFDSAFGIVSASAPQSPQPPQSSKSQPPAPHSPKSQSLTPQQLSLQQLLSRVSGPLFWIFFGFMILIFIGYAAYFMFAVLAPFNPQFFSSILNAVYKLPTPILTVLSLFIVFHMAIAAVLALLNFIVSFADFYLSKKSIKTYLISLLQSVSKPVLWMTVLFLGALIPSYVVGYFYPEIFEFLFNFSNLPEDGSLSVMVYIFLNNTRIVFMLMFLGFIFGLLPIVIILVNGFTIGIVAEYTIKYEGVVYLLTGLIPHGIIEIPAILLGAGVGYGSGVLASNVLIGRKTFEDFKQNFIGMTWIFFLIAVPLLFIAAIIEVYVTGPLLGVVF